MPHQEPTATSTDRFTNDYEQYEFIAKTLREKTRHRPTVAIICGSGLGGLADHLDERDTFDYQDIPFFPVSTVPGHVGRLIFGLLDGVEVVCMQGRFHFYEGWEMQKTTIPIRVFKLLGVETLIVTNAAGSVNPAYSVGDVMLLKDHINFPGMAGANPLLGPNDTRWGPRFQPLSNPYDKELRKLAKVTAESVGLTDNLHEGVYAMVSGPSFETIAEARALRILGADTVGMSTAPEAIIARHCGMRVVGFSLVTNIIVQDYESNNEPDHNEVLDVGKRRGVLLQKFVSALVGRIANSQAKNDQLVDHTTSGVPFDKNGHKN